MQSFVMSKHCTQKICTNNRPHPNAFSLHSSQLTTFWEKKKKASSTQSLCLAPRWGFKQMKAFQSLPDLRERDFEMNELVHGWHPWGHFTFPRSKKAVDPTVLQPQAFTNHKPACASKNCLSGILIARVEGVLAGPWGMDRWTISYNEVLQGSVWHGAKTGGTTSSVQGHSCLQESGSHLISLGFEGRSSNDRCLARSG